MERTLYWELKIPFWSPLVRFSSLDENYQWYFAVHWSIISNIYRKRCVWTCKYCERNPSRDIRERDQKWIRLFRLTASFVSVYRWNSIRPVVDHILQAAGIPEHRYFFANDYRPWVIVIIVSRSMFWYGYLASGIDAAANVGDSLFIRLGRSESYLGIGNSPRIIL